MRPEQLFDSLLAVADPTEHRYQARERIKSAWIRQFTISYGTDEGGEAMLLNGSTLQSLAMMNGKLASRATDSRGDGFLGKVVRSDMSNSRKISQFFPDSG